MQKPVPCDQQLFQSVSCRVQIVSQGILKNCCSRLCVAPVLPRSSQVPLTRPFPRRRIRVLSVSCLILISATRSEESRFKLRICVEQKRHDVSVFVKAVVAIPCRNSTVSSAQGSRPSRHSESGLLIEVK